MTADASLGSGGLGHPGSDAHTFGYEEAPRVLVVDDEAVILDVIKDVLEYEGFVVGTASDGASAFRELGREHYDIVLTDLKMPGVDGLELMQRMRSEGLPTKTIMMTGFGTVETAVDAMKKGAFDYILKPFKPEDVVRLLRRALDKQRLERENVALRETLGYYELSEALASGMPLSDQLQLIVELIRENFQADGVSIITNDPRDAGKFIARASTGVANVMPRIEHLLERFKGEARVLAHGGDVQQFLVNAKTAEHVAQSFISAPLRVRGQTVGIIFAVSVRAGHRFTEGQRKGLAVLSSRAASAIENNRMHEGLRSTFTETIEGLARALEAKDPYTAGHSDRVAVYARLIAQSLGMSQPDIDRVYHGGLMHDIGKIGINLSVLNKPQKLTEAEYEMFKSHTVKGKRIVEPISFLNHLIPFIYSHHEAWNGRGYPDGLAGTDIPFDGRLMAVADSYDAMTSNRPYRKALPHDIAILELTRCSAKQFDGDVVKAFLAVIDEFRRQRREQGLSTPD
ncbi:MAG: HD domain-containing phosphohydrolase [Myxococcota bacterium]|nr:HD domain-containing phosphohydrolase [Myxococcota bacterium]